MLEGAIKALRDAQASQLSKTIIYYHGPDSFEVRAVLGRAIFRTTNDYGAFVRTETRDFIIADGQFSFFPEAGDIIEYNGRNYEVLAPAGESVWRWSDPYHTAMRVHTKLTGGENG